MSITHTTVAVTADDGSEVGTDAWNEAHTITDITADDVVADTVEVVGSGGATQSDVSAPLVVASGSAAQAAIYRASADATGAYVNQYKARGSIGSPAVVQANDAVGGNYFYAHDGSSFKPAAAIFANVGPTPTTNDTPGRLTFSTTSDGASSLTSRWVIYQGGNLTPAAASTYKVGETWATLANVHTDLVTTDGVAFPATEVPNADPNTISDYEEGTFTPGLAFPTPGDSSIVLSTATGWYRKVGALCHVSLSIVTSTFTWTTASGALRITGLPFASATGTVNMLPAITGGWTWSPYVPKGLVLSAGQSYGQIWFQHIGTSAPTFGNNSATPTGSSLTAYVCGTYLTA